MRKVMGDYRTQEIFNAWYGSFNYKAYIVSENDGSIALKIEINDSVIVYEYCQDTSEARSMENNIRLGFGMCYRYIKHLIF